MIYSFPVENMEAVVCHINTWDVKFLSLAMVGDNYKVTTDKQIPEDQLEHLDIVRVL